MHNMMVKYRVEVMGEEESAENYILDERIRAHLASATGGAIEMSDVDGTIAIEPDAEATMQFVLHSWHRLRDSAAHFGLQEDIMDELGA